MTPTTQDRSLERRPYKPYGAALQLLLDRSPEVLLSGPAGTGKSRACLEKLHLCAEKYPGMRGLILRQTRESLTESALVTWEQQVLPSGHSSLAGPRRHGRSTYSYPNGSEIAVRGLRQGGADQAARVMSAEYDLVYIQEATELREESWEAVTTRLRNGKMPYQQLIADCNPDRPTHWLKRRSEAGRCDMLESRHEDNPKLWDHVVQSWTEAGERYLAKLDALTGARLLRLRHGRWVQAEGVVYSDFDVTRHVIDSFEPPKDWPRLWSVDFGFTNPFVWLEWAIDYDNRLYLLRQIYRTRRIVEDHTRTIMELTSHLPPPVAVVCDHDAEGRATLEKYLGIGTVAARKEVSAGIQSVVARLKNAGDGKPRLFFCRDSLVERDETLAEAHRPCRVEEEFDHYCWSESKETPVKEHDHGLDAVRYLVHTLDSEIPVE